MTKKEYVKSLRGYLKQFKDCRARVKELERRILTVQSMEEREKLTAAYGEAFLHARNVFKFIELTEGEKEKRVLELHYIDCKSWGEIARAVKYSYGYCTHIEEAALRSLVDKKEVIAILENKKKSLK